MDWDCISYNLFDFIWLALNFCEYIGLFVTNATFQKSCNLDSGWVSYDLNKETCLCRIKLARIWLSSWLEVSSGGPGLGLVDGRCLEVLGLQQCKEDGVEERRGSLKAVIARNRVFDNKLEWERICLWRDRDGKRIIVTDK